MSAEEQVRFWKDPKYRDAVSGTCTFPGNPAGSIELDAEVLGTVRGGRTEYLISVGCCGGLTTECANLTLAVCSVACFTIWFSTDAVCRPAEQ